jgi:hypothetical protein
MQRVPSTVAIIGNAVVLVVKVERELDQTVHFYFKNRLDILSTEMKTTRCVGSGERRKGREKRSAR